MTVMSTDIGHANGNADLPPAGTAGAAQDFLDAVLDEAIRCIEDGQPSDVDRWSASRPDLRAQIEQVVRRAAEIAVAPTASLPTIQGYVLLSLLGQGGMGAVYLARQERLGGRPIALKVLPQAAALSPRARERFRAEALAIARLRHPNIVQVYDVVEHDGVYAYAMEWVDGQSLADVIRDEATKRRDDEQGDPSQATRGARRCLDPASVARVGVAIARALAEVHRAGLLHRDVKPSNILLRRDGTPLLSDFGLVRDADAAITQPGHFAGTAAYASPEQLRGDSDSLDARSDVYSLGTTLYHLLTLRPAFTGDNPAALLRPVEAGRYPPPRRINPRITGDLQTIVMKAMDAEPARRYQTADELADDLERLLNVQPIRARPAGLLTRSIKLVRRQRGVFASALAATALTLGMCIAVVVWWIVMPHWAAGHVGEARLALVDPDAASAVVELLYIGEAAAQHGTRAADKARFDRALAEYAAALRLAPLDRSIRREMEVVAAARHGRPPPHDDPRSLGLHAYVSGDFPRAIDEWGRWETAHDPLAEPDPLVNAALGVLYLFDDQPARAYPRLQKAAEAFPDVGFVLEYLADAAAKCGDCDRARRWLEQSGRMSRRDPAGAGARIHAAILAAEGRIDEAIAAYRPLRYWSIATLELIRLLERQGRVEEGLAEFVVLAERSPGWQRLTAEFRRHADRWWAAVPRGERLYRIRAALDDPKSVLLATLRTYSRGGVQPNQRRRAPPLLLRPFVPACVRPFLPFSSALFDSLSSPSLQSLSLSELAERMEVDDMSHWNRIAADPRSLEELRVAARNWSALKPVVRFAVAHLIGLVTAITTQPALGQEVIADRCWDVTGKRYLLLSPSSWSAAQATAVSLGGNLVTVGSADENAWLVSELTPMAVNHVLWIGLTRPDTSSPFSWVSGAPLSYTNWHAGEPSNGDSCGGELRARIDSDTFLGQWGDAVDDPVACYGSLGAYNGVVELPWHAQYYADHYATVDDPVNLTFAPSGELFVGRETIGFGNPVKIHRIGLGGTPVSEYGAVGIEDPDAVVCDVAGVVSGVPGTILVGGAISDPTGRITAIRPDQSVVTLFESNDWPNIGDMEFDSAGRLVFCSAGWTPPPGLFVSTGSAPVRIANLPAAGWNIAVTSSNEIVVSLVNGVIQQYSPNGALINANFATLASDAALEFGRGGVMGNDLYALEWSTRTLYRIPADGPPQPLLTGISGDLKVGPDGILYSSDFYSVGSPNNRIVRILPAFCISCDANCDGSVNGFDVDPFVDLLTGGGTPCSPCAGDVNGDGSVNGFDIDGLVNALTGGGC
ncbi:MAG: Serine/threonine-protein kinase PknD [Phycisphaerae bacterium]|nr:Serine/threonine-protein kinase PknD [Phycisphaerae bacterium]